MMDPPGVIFHLRFKLILTLTLPFLLSFTWRLTYAILSLLGRTWMDVICTLRLGVMISGTCPYVLKWFFLSKESLVIWMAQISPITLQGTEVSVAFVTGFSLAFILQAGKWASILTQATLYFSTYITTTDWHQYSFQHAVTSLSE